MHPTIKSEYLGDLRTSSIHLKSGQILITDAPTDNNGKGEAFSPTDLLANSLATCMITIMGIVAAKNGLKIEGLTCLTTKIMSVSPRKVAEIIIEFNFTQKNLSNNFSDKEKEILKEAAYSCPVALSLHPDLKKTIIFNF